MPESTEGSVQGRGQEEMMPERGDPFELEEGIPQDLSPEELAGLYPAGHDRGGKDEDDSAEMNDEEGAHEPDSAARGAELPEDHGLGAVGPPLAEDLFAEAEEGPLADSREIALPVGEAPSARGEPRFSTLTDLAPSPIAGVEPPPATETLPPDQDMVGLLVPEERVGGLWRRADDLRDRIYGNIDNLHLARQLLDQVERARNQLMSGRENYEEAERALSEVEYRIHHAGRVREWSRTIGTRLLLYELAWALAIVLGMMYLPNAVSGFVASSSTLGGTSNLLDASIGVTTMLWGGLGGVVGALVALRKHVARDQDFDRQWSIWYITNPLMGVVLGAFVFLLVRAGLFALLPGSEAQIQSTWLIYAFAWLAGFQQNVAYGLVERVVRIFDVERSTVPDKTE